MFPLSDSFNSATDRWRLAQQYEQAFWQRLGDGIDSGTREQLAWYQWRAGQLERRLLAAGATWQRAGRILEIGSGPIGIVNFLDAGERFAVDPLEHFYRTRPSLVRLRKPEVSYIDGAGEYLPVGDGTCSLVIIDNVIDHTTSPPDVMRQIARVLAPGGWLYLSVNVHTAWGAFLHTLLAVLRIDQGHPHTFTSRSLRRFLVAQGFAVEAEEIEDARTARRTDLASPRFTDRIKGMTGLSEFSHCVLCRTAARSGDGVS